MEKKKAINHHTPRMDKNTRYEPTSITLNVWNDERCLYIPYLEEGEIVSFKNSVAAKKYATEKGLRAIVSYTNHVPAPTLTEA